MSKIEQKLKENRNRRAREKLLSTLDEASRIVLSNSKYDSDISCLKYAAFPTWDIESDCQTTTRGIVDGWQNETFKYWDDLVEKIRNSDIENNLLGWFFIDTDGPFYLLEWCEMTRILDSISNYAKSNEHYDFGWVGANSDFGIIAEFEHTSFCRNEFEVSKWGI